MYGLLLLSLRCVVEDRCVLFIPKFAYSKLAKYNDLVNCVVNVMLQKGQFLMIFAGYVALKMKAIIHGMQMKLRQLEHE